MQRKTRFWSLIELTIILIVLSILCAILAPVIDRYVRNAKIIRAREDVQCIGCTIWMFLEDTGGPMFYADAHGDDIANPMRDGGGGTGGAPDQTGNTVTLLVGDGDIPEVYNAVTMGAWDDPVGINFPVIVDFMERHLITNAPFGDHAERRYRTPMDLHNGGGSLMFARDESGGFNSEFAWRGAYITAPIDPDPWGNRYMANVEFLDPKANSDGDNTRHINGVGGWANDVVVLTAGPDEEVDTEYAADGLPPGDDDIIFTVSANSRP